MACGPIQVKDRGGRPQITESLPRRTDSWQAPDQPGDPPIRDAAGEYLGVTILRDGGLAVVSPIQNVVAGRFGFCWWRFDRR